MCFAVDSTPLRGWVGIIGGGAVDQSCSLINTPARVTVENLKKKYFDPSVSVSSFAIPILIRLLLLRANHQQVIPMYG